MQRLYSRPIELLLRLAIHATSRSLPILLIRRTVAHPNLHGRFVGKWFRFSG
jgi:hypothetical protein